MKTHVSRHMFEFAKRYYFKGQEVTPLPVGAIFTSWRSIGLLVAELTSFERKGLFSRRGMQNTIEDLHRFFGRPPSFRKRRAIDSVLCFLCTAALTERISPAYLYQYLTDTISRKGDSPAILKKMRPVGY